MNTNNSFLKTLIFLSLFFIYNWVNAQCIENKNYLDYYKTQLENYQIKYENITNDVNDSYKWKTKSYKETIIKKRQENLKTEIEKIDININYFQEQYNECLNNSSEDENIYIWIEYYNNWNFLEAINFLNKSYKKNPNNNIVKSYIALSYDWIWDKYFFKKEYIEAISYYKKSLELYPYDFNSNSSIWASYYNIWDYYSAIKHYITAYENTDNIVEQNKIYQNISKAQLNLRNKNKISNDEFSSYQYYLTQFNIPKAWGKVKNNNEVIVAVIDSWVDTNHPDLIDNIWINPTWTYWESKNINFVSSEDINIPSDEHWTNVAWIIWAVQNNWIWIRGISKNVKIMPLRVFWFKDWWKDKYIINAINYAIDNGANIINLSLWWTHYDYTSDYDEVLKKAYSKWIVVVISAGNWDDLSLWTIGVNLTKNPLSPICNNSWDNKYSIWVFSITKDWKKSYWSNYGICSPFYAPWENIFTTTIMSKKWSHYEEVTWTSFSAPIISWIIALWYNEYWYIPPDIVYNSLKKAQTYSFKNGLGFDTIKYLEELWKYKK